MTMKTKRQETIIIYLYYTCIIVGPLTARANEYDVYKKITANYDKNVRPTHNTSQATLISIELSEFHLLSMDQIQQSVTFTTELLVIWKDEILKWNVSEFEGTESVLIPSSLLWRPDIIFKTSLTADNMMPEDQRFMRVQYDGIVRSDSPYLVTCQCALSIETFPFDEQICEILLGSWMYPSTEINLVIAHTIRNESDAVYLTGNDEWKLLSFNSNILHYEWKEDGIIRPFVNVIYSVTLKRQPVYYICVLLIPTFVTATICLFGLFVPATNTGERIEKVNMGLETMLSIAIILGIVAGEMPKSTTLPLLGFYVLAELLLCTLGVGVSMLMMLAHQRVTTRTLRPPWWLTKITFLFPNECTKQEKKSIKENSMEKSIIPRSKYFLMENQLAIDSIMISIKRHNQMLEKLERYIDEKKLEDHIVLQWIIIFDRIDTFFLILFNLINISMSSSMLL